MNGQRADQTWSCNFSLFATEFRRTIHTVRLPEKTQALQEFRAAELYQEEQRNPRLRVHYGADEWGTLSVP